MGGQTEETATKKEPRVIDGPGRKKKSRKKKHDKKPAGAPDLIKEEPKGEAVVQFDIKEEPVEQVDVKPEPVEQFGIKEEPVEQFHIEEEPFNHVNNIQKFQAKEKAADENQNIPDWASQTSAR
jgi:hypothetical protein